VSCAAPNKLRAEGFAGSYPTVVRAVRAIRGPRFRAAAAVSVQRPGGREHAINLGTAGDGADLMNVVDHIVRLTSPARK
jgi:hypothetical protein